MPDTLHNAALRTQIQQNLNQFEYRANDRQDLISAAVVLGISTTENTTTASLLLTRRSSKLRRHAGQFALPGGRVDDGESTIEAALRELQEELGLLQCESSVLGLLDDMPTESGFNITPIVVWIDESNTIKANPDEVAEVFHIPLTELLSLDLDVSHEEPDHTDRNRPRRPVATKNNTDNICDAIMSVYLPTVGTTIYSPTAAIIYQFREVALFGRTTRVAHFGQPRFAWR